MLCVTIALQVGREVPGLKALSAIAVCQRYKNGSEIRSLARDMTSEERSPSVLFSWTGLVSPFKK